MAKSGFLADPDCPTLVEMSSKQNNKSFWPTQPGGRAVSLFSFFFIELNLLKFIELNSLLTFLKDARERGAHDDVHTSSPLPGQVGPGLTV